MSCNGKVEIHKDLTEKEHDECRDRYLIKESCVFNYIGKTPGQLSK